MFMRYIFFGTSEFAAIIISRLIATGMAPLAVVTQPDRPAGRGKKLQESPMKLVVKKHNIPLLQPEKIKDYRLQITELKPDFCIIAAYGEIIPKEILKIPKYGFLNVHPSFLPKYRGPSPIQSSILNGDTETGLTIILLDEQVDHGPIIANDELGIMNYVTAPQLEQKLAMIGAELLVKTIPAWVAGKITPVPQDHVKATFTKMITKEDGHIEWKKSAEEIERHVRAMAPWPGSWTIWEHEKKEIRIHLRKVLVHQGSSRLGSNSMTLPYPLLRRFGRSGLRGESFVAGKVLAITKNAMIVACAKDALAIHTLQPEGKKEMTAHAFVNGHRSIIGSVLE